MREHGWSMYVEGELTKPDGQSCAPDEPDDCVPATRSASPGASTRARATTIAARRTATSAWPSRAGGTTHHAFTIHGDHWFFNGFPQGAEIVERRAQWVADADLDRDGETTIDELRETRASDAFPSSEYSLSGSPIPIRRAPTTSSSRNRTPSATSTARASAKAWCAERWCADSSELEVDERRRRDRREEQQDARRDAEQERVAERRRSARNAARAGSRAK